MEHFNVSIESIFFF